MKLLTQALTKFIAGLLLMGLLLFVPAGTLHYFGGWLLMGILFIPMLILGILLFCKEPALLQKRLDAKESDSTQKKVVALSGLGFLAQFVLAGLDFRFGWLPPVPRWGTLLAAAFFLAGYVLYGFVMKQNAYLSRTVRVQEGQRVIDTGLYGVVRHPMYGATLLLFAAMPLVLGSWLAFILFFHYPPLLAVRIRKEEQLLAQQLEGYTDYQKKVPYKVIPGIW